MTTFPIQLDKNTQAFYRGAAEGSRILAELPADMGDVERDRAFWLYVGVFLGQQNYDADTQVRFLQGIGTRVPEPSNCFVLTIRTHTEAFGNESDENDWHRIREVGRILRSIASDLTGFDHAPDVHPVYDVVGSNVGEYRFHD